MTILPIVASSVALALAPADRLKLADGMFGKGLYAEAAAEYAVLKGEKTVSAEDIEFRAAECDRMLGRAKEALAAYGRLAETAESRKIRAAALYRIACEKDDVSLFAECEKADPKGDYAQYARLRRATLLSKQGDAASRREATGLFLDLMSSTDRSIAEDAAYSAAALAYGDKRWNEAAILFSRLEKKYPGGERAKSSRVPHAWSAFLAGRHSECLAVCGDGADEDLMFLRGSALLAVDRKEQGLGELEKYLAAYPAGKYKASAETPVERAKFDAAVKRGDSAAAVEAAARAAAASGLPADALRLAWARENAGAAAEARAEYRRIAAAWPEDPVAAEAIFANALADFREENWGAAELALGDLVSRFPDFPRRNEAMYWRGVAAIRLGHDDEGAAHLASALSLGLPLDMSREANLAIAGIDARAGRKEAAASRYASQIASGAVDRLGAAHLASVLDLLAGSGEWNALLAGSRALEKRTSDPAFRQIAAAREGQALEGLSRSEEAVAAYRKAFSVKADTAEGAQAALSLGRLEFRMGEYDAAVKTLEDAVARNSGSGGLQARAAAYRLLADASRAKGDERKAKGYETVLKELFGAQ